MSIKKTLKLTESGTTDDIAFLTTTELFEPSAVDLSNVMVRTIKGNIPASKLEIRHEIKWTDTSRAVAVEYYLGEELVRRAVFVDILQPPTMEAKANL